MNTLAGSNAGLLKEEMETEHYPMTLQCISHSMKNVDWYTGKSRCCSLTSAWPWTRVCERFFVQEPNPEVFALALSRQSKQEFSKNVKRMLGGIVNGILLKCWGVPKSLQNFHQKDSETWLLNFPRRSYWAGNPVQGTGTSAYSCSHSSWTSSPFS